jgi:hypothetical protein
MTWRCIGTAEIHDLALYSTAKSHDSPLYLMECQFNAKFKNISVGILEARLKSFPEEKN